MAVALARMLGIPWYKGVMEDIARDADRYYADNGKAQRAFVPDYLQEHLRSLTQPDMRVLEIGCSSGFRLDDLSRTVGCECEGIDPSRDAIAEGTARYPHISLQEGYAHTLPYQDQSFDVVLVPTVFYRIPRELLLRSVAEADRVLKDGGILVIDDFYPDAPHRRAYKHIPGAYTYKQEYWSPFVASGLYSIMEKLPHRFHGTNFEPGLSGGDDSCIAVVMRKSLEGNYPIHEIP